MAETLGSQIVAEWLKSGTPDEPHTQGALAARLSERVRRRVAQSTVSAIARAASTPRGDLMSALKAELGIDIEAWTTHLDPIAIPDDAA